MIFLHSCLLVVVLRSSGMERAIHSKILFIQFSLWHPLQRLSFSVPYKIFFKKLVSCYMPKTCQYPSLDSCQQMWADQGCVLVPHVFIGFMLHVGNAELLPEHLVLKVVIFFPTLARIVHVSHLYRKMERTSDLNKLNLVVINIITLLQILSNFAKYYCNWKWVYITVLPFISIMSLHKYILFTVGLWMLNYYLLLTFLWSDTSQHQTSWKNNKNGVVTRRLHY